jgi:protein disulfide-isomerase
VPWCRKWIAHAAKATDECRAASAIENPASIPRGCSQYSRLMKTFLSLIALAALTTSVFAVKDGWMDDLAKAQAKAKAENKKILLDFTGSDWCGWCKKLDAEVFSQQEFKDYAAKKLVLVELDFPHGFKLAATQKQNEALAKKFQIRGYPTIVITSASGARKGELGYVEGGPKAFIKALEKAK